MNDVGSSSVGEPESRDVGEGQLYSNWFRQIECPHCCKGIRVRIRIDGNMSIIPYEEGKE